MKNAQSAGIVIVRYENNEPKVLFMRSYSYWDFPKGGVEEHENKLEAAIREVQEEAGITELNFRWGRTFHETQAYGRSHKKVAYFIAETTQTDVVMGVNPDMGKPEHDEYQWLTFEQARAKAVDRIAKVLDWAQERMGAYLPHQVNALEP